MNDVDDATARGRLSPPEWHALMLALIIAHAFYARGVVYPSAYDASTYRSIATDIASIGLFAKFELSNLRTYGYPLFLSALKYVAEAVRLPWGLVVFEVQLAIYVAVTLAIRRSVAIASPRLARSVWIALVLNPFALLYTTDTLSETLSLSLVMLAAACWIRLYVTRTVAWKILALGSLAIGFALAVRPANVYALPAWIVGVIALAWNAGWRPRYQAVAVLAVALLTVLPTVPQVVNNVRHFDKWTPFVAFDLGKFQLYWGVLSLKYATALPPLAYPSVYYENPLVVGRPIDQARPLDWYRNHPAAAMVTLGLHVFGMLDQDLLFTYARDLDPWYRRPLGVLTHGAIALAVLGLALLAWRSRKDRGLRIIATTLGLLICAHVALHAATAVEMRFGLPLLVLAGPLAGWFVLSFWTPSPARRRAAVVTFVVAWIAASLLLSDWIRDQAPQIVAWNAKVPFVPKPR